MLTYWAAYPASLTPPRRRYDTTRPVGLIVTSAPISPVRAVIWTTRIPWWTTDMSAVMALLNGGTEVTMIDRPQAATIAEALGTRLPDTDALHRMLTANRPATREAPTVTSSPRRYDETPSP